MIQFSKNVRALIPLYRAQVLVFDVGPLGDQAKMAAYAKAAINPP
jgi:hypothetical protein